MESPVKPGNQSGQFGQSSLAVRTELAIHAKKEDPAPGSPSSIVEIY